MGDEIESFRRETREDALRTSRGFDEMMLSTSELFREAVHRRAA
jgi:hypothetical protein